VLAPLFLLILRLRTFFFFGYVKTSWKNSKHGLLHQLHVLKRTNYKSCKMWAMCGMYAELQMALIVKCFAPNNFLTCKKLFQLMNKILQAEPSHLFSFISYRCLKYRHYYWYTLYYRIRALVIILPSIVPYTCGLLI
jgi:hypothetical protein